MGENRWGRVVHLAAVCILVVCAASGAAAQTVVADAPGDGAFSRRVERLDSALREAASAAHERRPWVSVGSLLVGSALTASGAWLVTRDGADRPQTAAGMIGPALVLGIGAMELVNGLRVAFGPYDTDMERLRRWESRLAEGPLDGQVVARFEGEFCGDQAVGSLQRVVDQWVGVGYGVGGATLIGLSVGVELPSRARTAGLLMGGFSLALGLWEGGALLLAPEPAECLPHPAPGEPVASREPSIVSPASRPSFRVGISGFSGTF